MKRQVIKGPLWTKGKQKFEGKKVRPSEEDKSSKWKEEKRKQEEEVEKYERNIMKLNW